jgi:hypothetical protein
MDANQKFKRERDLVELLMRRRGLSVERYVDRTERCATNH